MISETIGQADRASCGTIGCETLIKQVVEMFHRNLFENIIPKLLAVPG